MTKKGKSTMTDINAHEFDVGSKKKVISDDNEFWQVVLKEKQ